MAPKKLKVEIPEPNPEIAEILEKLKVKSGVVPEEPKKISERQKEHLDKARVAAMEGKKKKEEKIKFLESYYLEQEKAHLNALKEKEIYKKRKEKNQKPAPPPPIEEESIADDEDEDDVEYSEVEEESEEEPEYVPPPPKPKAKKQPAKVTVPVKKKTQPPPKRQPPSNQGYNPFGGIMG